MLSRLGRDKEREKREGRPDGLKSGPAFMVMRDRRIEACFDISVGVSLNIPTICYT